MCKRTEYLVVARGVSEEKTRALEATPVLKDDDALQELIQQYLHGCEPCKG